MNELNKLVVIGITMLILDYLYINFLILPGFSKMINKIQRREMSVRIIPAILCYMLMIFGLYFLIINSKVQEKQKLINSFVLGLVIYGVYDLTNYATIINWSSSIAIMDMIWGGVLFLSTTYITLKLIKN